MSANRLGRSNSRALPAGRRAVKSVDQRLGVQVAHRSDAQASRVRQFLECNAAMQPPTSRDAPAPCIDNLDDTSSAATMTGPGAVKPVAPKAAFYSNYMASPERRKGRAVTPPSNASELKPTEGPQPDPHRQPGRRAPPSTKLADNPPHVPTRSELSNLRHVVIKLGQSPRLAQLVRRRHQP